MIRTDLLPEDYIDILHKSYGVSTPLNESVIGSYSKDFAGPVTWSRGFDVSVPGYPEVRGMRFMDFKDCTNYFVILNNGDVLNVFGDDLKVPMAKAVAEAILNKWPNYTAFKQYFTHSQKVSAVTKYKRYCKQSVNNGKTLKIK